MDARDCREVGARRGIARQHLKRLALERALDRAQAVRPLGMTLAHLMREAGGVRNDERGPVFGVLRGDFRLSRACAALSRARRRKSIRQNVRDWRIASDLT